MALKRYSSTTDLASEVCAADAVDAINVPPPKVHHARRLSVVDEDDHRLYDDGDGGGDVGRGGGRHLGHGPKRQRPAAAAQQQQHHHHRSKKASLASKENRSRAGAGISLKVPVPRRLPLSAIANGAASSSAPSTSSPPLPPGVRCIDGGDGDDYWPEFTAHIRQKESGQLFQVRQLLNSSSPDLEVNRARLMRWLLDVSLHFRVSQEALYHTVHLIDSVLVKRDVRAEMLQLV
jgi:hypothetical protein